MEKERTVLVTGGAGYIGSHTAVELSNAGFDVILADDLSNSDMAAVEGVRIITGKRIPFEKVDCNYRYGIEEVFAKHKFGSVIHFAAFKAVGESVEEPLKYYSNNIGSLVNVLYWMKLYNVPNLVFSSSATVYGQPDKLPATEETPRKPATSPYGNTKQIGEDILRDSVNAYGEVKGISLRYFNPIGAHPSALIGELPKGVPNNLVPYITQTAAGILPELNIFGDDYKTPDGTALRDYIDVIDLAKAHVVAVKRMIEGKMKNPYEVFNIGTGKPVSVMELVNTFEQVNGIKVPHKIVGRRKGDVESVWADTKLANTELGWKAERTLEETLRSAWEWERSHRELE